MPAMGERCGMKFLAAIFTASLFGLLVSASGVAQPLDAGVRNAQAQGQKQRARTRVRIGPRYPYRRYHSLYPLPYPVEYPGPNAKRECVARYVTELRPSGTVIVPKTHCWWVRG
jgi:hypothetical protein